MHRLMRTLRRLPSRSRAVLAAALLIPLALAACGSSSPNSPSSAGDGTSWSSATSAAAGGGFKALVAAAKKEGQLNLIALPSDWVDYGEIISSFEAKYGIHVTVTDPEAGAQQELTAVQTLRGDSRAPDAVDVSAAQTGSGMSEGLFAPYKVKEWSNIPATSKNANGYWTDDYGGYIAIGYNADVIKTPPTSWTDLEKPIYKNKVGLMGGDPTTAGDAFASVYSAALGNGGSANNILPGIKYFQHLRSIGNLVPVDAQPSTIESGQTPIAIDWDFNQATYATQFKGKFNWKFVIPSDGSVGEYYVQAVSKYAPHPAAARLWEEYLYSNVGQNYYLEGHARPVELASLAKAHTVNIAAAKLLPTVPSTGVRPTAGEISAAKAIVLNDWNSSLG